ncbi:hypothetical protein MKX67_20795 [Cytobacillus sp. FSL W7-1323]|nr:MULTISPECIES: hypothetical protein [Cytobacillus]MEA1853517.1 hypothetical protein [Cytobacillus sp. OWB-43]
MEERKESEESGIKVGKKAWKNRKWAIKEPDKRSGRIFAIDKQKVDDK